MKKHTFDSEPVVYVGPFEKGREGLREGLSVTGCLDGERVVAMGVGLTDLTLDAFATAFPDLELSPSPDSVAFPDFETSADLDDLDSTRTMR